jgi:hypothetical protein
MGLAGQKEFEKALAEIKKAVDLEPGNAEIRKTMKEIQASKREYDKTSLPGFKGKLTQSPNQKQQQIPKVVEIVEPKASELETDLPVARS